MVVGKIHIESLSILEAEDNAPVGPDRDRSKSSQITFQQVKAQGRLVQGLYGRCGIKRNQDPPDAIHHIRGKLSPVILLVEPLEPLVPKAFKSRA